ncbi:MAG: hypothetical protein WDZ85_03260 [Candidatus Paceibacterota bacterium]
MEDKDLKQKMARARQAMAGQDYDQQKKRKQAELAKRREEAAAAMLGQKQREKNENQDRELLKARAAAAKAMETPEQKRKRELAENQARNHALAEKRLAELKTQAETEEKLKLTEHKDAKQQEIEAKKKHEEEYLARLKASNDLIEKITSRDRVKTSPYHTLRTDIDKTVSTENLSLTDIALKQKKTEPAKKPDNKKTLKYLAGIMTVGILLAGGSGLVYFTNNYLRQTTITAPAYEPLVPANLNKKLEVTGLSPAQIIGTINREIIKDRPSDAILNIYLTGKLVTADGQESQESFLGASAVLTAMNLDTPTDFHHFLEPEYMLGAYQSETARPFIIVTTKSFENTFSALLNYENEIVGALLKIFDPSIDSQLKGMAFSDQIINNIDIRLAENQTTGETIALYAFLDRQTIIFTQDREVIEYIVRLGGLNR